MHSTFGFMCTFPVKVDAGFLQMKYSGSASKRLEGTVTSTNVNITDVEVNGENVDNSLEKEDEIPQAENYTLVFHFESTDSSYSLDVSIQRWIYYNKRSISLNDLDFSEAYLQEIEFGSDGRVLRIDDDPDGELTGSANEKIVLTDVVIPFRKLEWISGSGEALILGVE